MSINRLRVEKYSFAAATCVASSIDIRPSRSGSSRTGKIEKTLHLTLLRQCSDPVQLFYPAFLEASQCHLGQTGIKLPLHLLIRKYWASQFDLMRTDLP